MLLTTVTPARELDIATILGTVALAAFALAPLLVALGPGRPGKAAAWVAGGAFLVAATLLVTPPGSLLRASDLGVGFGIASLAAGVLAASAIPR